MVRTLRQATAICSTPLMALDFQMIVAMGLTLNNKAELVLLSEPSGSLSATWDEFKRLHPENEKPGQSTVKRLQVNVPDTGSVRHRCRSVLRRPVTTQGVGFCRQTSIRKLASQLFYVLLQDVFYIVQMFTLLNCIAVLHWRTKMVKNVSFRESFVEPLSPPPQKKKVVWRYCIS